jgi:hypothetical protein
MHLTCLVLGHHRSRGRAVEDDEFGWRSVCKRCGVPMVRIDFRKWVPESRARPRAGREKTVRTAGLR